MINAPGWFFLTNGKNYHCLCEIKSPVQNFAEILLTYLASSHLKAIPAPWLR
jgi:hypothetical protein